MKTLNEIKALATRTAQENRPANLSDSDLMRRMDMMSNLMYEQDSDDDEFKVHRTEYNARKKERAASIRAVLNDIREKQTMKEQTVYYVPDFDKGRMEIYNEFGDLIENRRLRIEERQTSIHELPQTKAA
jgi:hypothetical protein